MDTGNVIKSLAESLGADYFGIADLKPAQKFILEQGGPGIAKYPTGISIGIALLDSLVDLLPDRETSGGSLFVPSSRV